MRSAINREKLALRVLYVLALYVLLQLMWWGYQLIQINAELIRSNTTDLDAQYFQIRSKVWMVAGEGIVFFMLLAIGFRYIKRTVSRELDIARKESNFLLSVTHELKTPIAAVKLFLETLQSRNLSDDKKTEIVQLSIQETKRLQSLTENILLAARLDNRTDGMTKSSVNLSECLHREIKRFQSLTSTVIEATIQNDVIVEGDEQMLSALVSNLIDNAVKYGAGQVVEVQLQSDSHNISLSVRDRGLGIPAGEEKRIFDKFYRMGSEETRTSKGTGLGLFIVKSVALMHKAEVSVSNRPSGGANFKVIFKKK
jgi:two-component system phosphate regulon sensor histidine kinase PhoR